MIRLSHLFRAFCVVLLALALGCSPAARQTQSVAATSFAAAGNTALVHLHTAYRDEGLRAIDAAPTRAEGEAALVVVRAKWRPVWQAWEAVRAAQNAWATALESGAKDDEIARTMAAFGQAYCKLLGVLPAGVALPQVDGLGCGP
jgi:murein L,D-transpeptidase YcbB/YkuD